MEELTRNNYEEWFVDYLDGRLDGERLSVLKDFLAENPDLAAELNSIDGFFLESGPAEFQGREILMKGPSDIPGVPEKDRLCIARMEGDLTAVEAVEFDRQAGANPALGALYGEYLGTRLNVPAGITYPNRKELYRKTRILSPWLITVVSAAAVVIVALMLWPDRKSADGPAMAVSAGTNEPVRQEASPKEPVEQPVALAVNQPSKPKVSARKSESVKPAANSESALPPREQIRMEKMAGKALSGPGIPDPQFERLLFASTRMIPEPGVRSQEEVLTIPQFALQQFRQRILGQDREMVRKNRFTLWEVAGAGVNRINDFAGTKMKLDRQYDDNGELLAVSFNSRLFGVEAPVRNQAAR